MYVNLHTTSLQQSVLQFKQFVSDYLILILFFSTNSLAIYHLWH